MTRRRMSPLRQRQDGRHAHPWDGCIHQKSPHFGNQAHVVLLAGGLAPAPLYSHHGLKSGMFAIYGPLGACGVHHMTAAFSAGAHWSSDWQSTVFQCPDSLGAFLTLLNDRFEREHRLGRLLPFLLAASRVMRARLVPAFVCGCLPPGRQCSCSAL